MDEKRPRRRPNRKGVALHTFLAPEIDDAIERFLDAQEVAPKKTSVVQKALREYLSRLGYLPPDPSVKVGIPLAGSVSAGPPSPHAVARDAAGGRSSAELWYVGPIAAGDPIEVFDDPQEQINLGDELGGEGRFIFTVRGDSMVEERIFDGDQVIIQRDPWPKDGDAVVVRYGGSLMLKKLVASKPGEKAGEKTIRVVSCDGKARGFNLQPGRDEVLGKFVAVYRKAK